MQSKILSNYFLIIFYREKLTSKNLFPLVLTVELDGVPLKISLDGFNQSTKEFTININGIPYRDLPFKWNHRSNVDESISGLI